MNGEPRVNVKLLCVDALKRKTPIKISQPCSNSKKKDRQPDLHPSAGQRKRNLLLELITYRKNEVTAGGSKARAVRTVSLIGNVLDSRTQL
jgi:hypothetical protein